MCILIQLFRTKSARDCARWYGQYDYRFIWLFIQYDNGFIWLFSQFICNPIQLVCTHFAGASVRDDGHYIHRFLWLFSQYISNLVQLVCAYFAGVFVRDVMGTIFIELYGSFHSK